MESLLNRKAYFKCRESDWLIPVSYTHLFNTEDLDNDDIIAMVEDSPTYMRDKTTLTKIDVYKRQDVALSTVNDEQKLKELTENIAKLALPDSARCV